MQEHPNGDISVSGFHLAAGQLPLTNTVLVRPTMGESGPFAKHWFNGKAYYTDEALRLDLTKALKRLNDSRTGVHHAG